MVKIEDLAAVKEVNDTNQVIGNLFLYSVPEQKIFASTFIETIKSCFGDDRFAPPKIRAVDAFKRAASEAEMAKVKDPAQNIFYNILIRDVVKDKEKIIKKVVVETVDPQGQRLYYEPEAATIEYSRKDEEINIDNNFIIPQVNEVCNKVYDLFYDLKNNYTAQHIRATILNIINHMAPTPLKDSGGVYFIPIEYEELLDKLILFTKKVNSSSLKVPMINNKENRDYVRDRLKEHLASTLESLMNISEDMPKSRIKEILTVADRVSKDFESYHGILAADAFAMENLAARIQEYIIQIEEKINNDNNKN